MEVVIKKGMTCKVLKEDNNIYGNLRSGQVGTRPGDPSLKIKVERVRSNPDFDEVYDENGRRYYSHELEPIIQNVEYFTKILVKEQKKVDEIQNKISFLKENNLSEYSEEKFKAYQAIKISKSEESIKDKINKIEKLLK